MWRSKCFVTLFFGKLRALGIWRRGGIPSYENMSGMQICRICVGKQIIRDMSGKAQEKNVCAPFAIGAEKAVRNLPENLLPAANRASRNTRKNSFLSSCNSLVGKRVASLKLPHRLSVGEQRSANMPDVFLLKKCVIKCFRYFPSRGFGKRKPSPSSCCRPEAGSIDRAK